VPGLQQLAPLGEPIAALVGTDNANIDGVTKAGFLGLEIRLGAFLGPSPERAAKPVRSRAQSSAIH